MATEPTGHTPFDTDEMREYAGQLFGREKAPESPPAAQQSPPGQYVPGEGANPATQPSDDEALREYVHDMFDEKEIR